jgi:hypothetical protein
VKSFCSPQLFAPSTSAAGVRSASDKAHRVQFSGKAKRAWFPAATGNVYQRASLVVKPFLIRFYRALLVATLTPPTKTDYDD